MEFRTNLLIWTTMGFLWFGLAFISVELIFGQIELIAGWCKEEIMLLVATTLLFRDLLWTFVWDGLNHFSYLIRKGELDLLLLKPIRTRFYASFRFPEFDHWLRIFFLVFFIRNLSADLGQPDLIYWLGYYIILGLGLFVFYNFLYVLATSNIWFIRLFNMGDLVDTFIGIGRQPMDIFKGGLRFFFTFLIPSALVSYLPVTFLLGRINLVPVLIMLPVVYLTFVFSRWFWRFSLKNYHSASS